MNESETPDIREDEDQKKEDPSEKQREASLKIDTLEPRILLSATWADADTGEEIEGATSGDDVFNGDSADNTADALAGDDQLFGDGGDDVLFGGPGDDVLSGGEGDDSLHGGDGADTADYSQASSGVTVDLTTGSAVADEGTDTLDNIEAVIGSEYDDTFVFADPADGAVYTIDGAGGSNMIDLTGFNRDAATFSSGALTIDLVAGESFTIEHDNISTVQFGDTHIDFVVWDGEGGTGNLSEAVNWSGDNVPDANDVLVFDGSSTDNAVFDSDFGGRIGGVLIGDGYTGRISLASDLTIEGELDVASGTFDARDFDLHVNGDLLVQDGRFDATSATVSLDGNLIIESGTFDDNSGTLQLGGDQDQVLQLSGETLNNLVVAKAGGTLTLDDDLEIRGNLTHTAGTVDFDSHTVTFRSHNATIDADGVTFGDVTINTTGTTTITNNLNVDGDLTIERANVINGGEVRVIGNITTMDSGFGGSATIVLGGIGDQSIYTNGGSGELHHVTIEKPAGTVMLTDDLEISGNLTHTAGAADFGSHTVTFRSHNATINAGGVTFGDVAINTTGTTTITNNLNVDGDLTIERANVINGGEVHVIGNITTMDTGFGGTATIVLGGAGDQAIDTNGGAGELHHVTIDKSGGTLALTDDLEISGDLTHTAGTVDFGSHAVTFQSHNATIDADNVTFGDVVINTTGTTTITDNLNVAGDLTIERANVINGGEVRVFGNMTTMDTGFGGTATIVLSGTGDQAIDTNGGAGELHHVTIDKSAGTLTLTDDLEISGNLTHTAGTVDFVSHAVTFQSHNATIDVGEVTFGDVAVNTTGTTTITDNLNVAGDLTIARANVINGGELNVIGDITTMDTGFGGTATIVLSGTGDQAIDTNGGAGELHHVTIDKSAGTLALTDDLEISGNLTHMAGTVDFVSHTVTFQSHNATIDAGEVTFGDVAINTTGTTTITDNLNVAGDLTIARANVINGGELNVIGNITTKDTGFGGSATIVLSGTGDQAIDTNGGAGELHHVTIDKSAGTLTLTDDLEISGNLTHTAGTVDFVSHAVTFQSHNATIDAGEVTFGDVAINTTGTTTITGNLNVDGDLTIERANVINGGEIRVTGSVNYLDNQFNGTATIMEGVVTFPHSDDFGDGVADGFQAIDGNWTVTDGSYQVDGLTQRGDNGIAVLNFADPFPEQFEIGVQLESADVSGQYQNGFVVFDWNGPNDFKFAGARVGANYWTVGHYDGSWVDDVRFDETIDTDTPYDLHVSVDGSEVLLSVDGIEKVTHDFGEPVSQGQVGLGADHAESQFDNLVVNVDVEAGAPVEPDPVDPVTFPHSDDFADGVADGFQAIDGNWTVTDGVYQVDGLTASGDNGTAVLNFDGPLPETFELGVQFESANVSGQYQNGFVVFDWNGPNDFKFAGARVGANYWTVGHYDGSWVDDVRFDETIDTDTPYDLHVSVDGSEVVLSVDGTEKVAYDFGELVNEGQVGLGADHAQSQFDNLVISTRNESPSATDDVVRTTEDTPVTTGNLLVNDLDVDGDTLSVDSFTQPTHGTVEYNEDGTFTYTPDPNYHGSDSFTYTVADGQGGADIATVDLTVEAVNDAPIVDAGADQTVTEGAAVTLTASASDLEGDDLTYAWEQLSGTPVELAGAGTSEPTFTAPYLTHGEELEFQVTVSDGEHSVFDSVTVTVDADNDLPVIYAGPDRMVVGGTTVALDADVSVAPHGIDFDDIAVESYGGSGQDINVVVSVEDGGDTLQLTGNGWKKIALPYTVTADTILEFDFRSSSEGEIHGIGFDNDDGLNANWTFKVHGTQNWGIDDHDDYDGTSGEWQHYRIRVGDHFTGDFDFLTFAMDHDVSNPHGDSVFSNVRVYEEGQGDPAGESISYAWEQVSGPPVTLSHENTLSPTFEAPDSQLYRQDIEFRVTASDGVHTVSDTVLITVEENPDDVIIEADDMVVNENEVVTLSVSTETAVGIIPLNDDAVESYGGNGQDINAVVSVEDGGDTLRLTGNGWKKIDFPYAVTDDTMLEFDFRSGSEGEIHGIGFDDDDQLNANRTFKVHGTQNWGIDEYDDYDGTQGQWQHYRIRVGDHFTGEFDFLTFAMDHDVSNPDAESVFSNIRVYEQGQTDTSGDGLTYAWQQVSGPPVTLENADTGNPTFTAPNLESSAEAEFQVTVSNGAATVTDTMTVSINATNDDPIAGADTYATDEDTAITTGNVLDNDTDADSVTLSVESFTQPENGTVHYNGDGTFTYTPNANFNGTDTFTYLVDDGGGNQDTATVNVAVNPIQDVPVAVDEAVTTDEDTAVTTGNVLANDTDVDGDTLTVDSFTQPAHGSVVYNHDGTFTYTPGTNYSGLDSFAYTVSDGHGGMDMGTVDLTVNAVADVPTLAVKAAAFGQESTPIALQIGSPLADTDGSEKLSIRIGGVPKGAVLSAGTDQGNGVWFLEPGDLERLTLTSPLGGAGEYRLTVEATATDANGLSAFATETIDVTVEPIDVTEPEDRDDENAWSEGTNLSDMDSGAVGEGVGELLNTAEELLQRTLDGENGGTLPLNMVGEIVGNGNREGIHLPDSEGDVPNTYELRPMRPTDAGVQQDAERLVPDDQIDPETAEVREWEGDDSEADAASKRGGIGTLLWGLLRGIAGTRNTEERDEPGAVGSGRGR